MKEKRKIGLSLSGGGFRAAAFHLGVMKKLNELGLLDKIDVLSTISGGSIIGATYCLHEGSFEEFEKKMYTVLNQKSVIKYVLTSVSFFKLLAIIFAGFTLSFFLTKYIALWLSIPVILLMVYLFFKYQFIIFPISKEVIKAYNKFFFHKAVLSELKSKPELAIGSTNLQSFRPFTFSKRKMEDSTYAYMKPPIKFKHENFPVAVAVAASSCVPNFFTPITIAEEYFETVGHFNRIRPVLVDGGIYDNQGIQKLTQSKSSYECDIIITSDAGEKLPFEGFYNNTFILLLRTVEAFMARIKNFQMSHNLYTGRENKKEIAYFSLAWDIENCIPGFLSGLKAGNITTDIIEAHKIPKEYFDDTNMNVNKITEWLQGTTDYPKLISNNATKEEIDTARSVKTNLTKLSAKKINALMKHAGNLTELQVKLYCPSLFYNS